MKERLVLLALVGTFIVWLSLLMEPSIMGQSYNETALVNTTVNITNSAPFVTDIALTPSVDLTAYGTKRVTCNVSVTDYDNDTVKVNASLYLEGITNPLSPDDGNNHYTNTSCTMTSPQNLYMNFSCGFDVQYFADNSTQWRCNTTVTDGSLPSTNLSNYATVNPLIAIKTASIIDYGELVAGQVSTDKLANITNAGNRDVNISVEGYGSTPGDGLAMTCDYGSISLNFERYNITANSDYDTMTQLTGSTTMIDDFYVTQRVSEVSESVNSTYWRISIPVGAAGVCNGKLLFTASDRGN